MPLSPAPRFVASVASLSILLILSLTQTHAQAAPPRQWLKQAAQQVGQTSSRIVHVPEELLANSRELLAPEHPVQRGLSRLASHLTSTNPRAASARSSPPVRLVPEAEHLARRALLPIVDDEELSELLASHDLIFYSESEMPRAFAKWNGLSAGVHDAYYNISGERGEPYGNGNREFPWDGAAGTHRAHGFETIHFVFLPRDAAGNVLPIVYQTTPADARGVGEVSWRYPHGTVFGECLLVSFGADRMLPCELRIRRRVEADWEVDVFRPFPTANHLADRVKTVRPDWESDASLVALIDHLHDSNNIKRGTLRDEHPNRSFDQVAGIDELPAMEVQLCETLLESTPFVSCLNTAWKTNDSGLVCHAPTTRHLKQIVPQNYDGGFVAVDAVSCLRCHATVGENVSRFEPQREWYGDIRGSDGIFSFHPFDRSGISFNGQSVPVVLRSDWQRAGILERFDPKRHLASDYSEFRPGSR